MVARLSYCFLFVWLTSSAAVADDPPAPRYYHRIIVFGDGQCTHFVVQKVGSLATSLSLRVYRLRRLSPITGHGQRTQMSLLQPPIASSSLRAVTHSTHGMVGGESLL
jgi:hypothetical protein